MKFNFPLLFFEEEKNNNHLSFIFDTDFLNFVLLERELEKSPFHLRKGLKINEAPRRDAGWTGYYFYSP